MAEPTGDGTMLLSTAALFLVSGLLFSTLAGRLEVLQRVYIKAGLDVPDETLDETWVKKARGESVPLRVLLFLALGSALGAIGVLVFLIKSNITG